MKKLVNYIDLDKIEHINTSYSWIDDTSLKCIYKVRDGEVSYVDKILEQLEALEERVYTFVYTYDVYKYIYAITCPYDCKDILAVIEEPSSDYVYTVHDEVDSRIYIINVGVMNSIINESIHDMAEDECIDMVEVFKALPESLKTKLSKEMYLPSQDW